MEKIGVVATVEDADSYFSTMKKMNATVDDFAKAGSSAGASFGGGFGSIVTGALREVGAVAVHALGDAARAVTGFLKDSISLAGDFQANMLQFQSVAGKGVDTKGLEQFKSLFISLGKELPVSTSDVQMAAIEMVKGGIDPATIAAGGLRQNIQFAAAAMGGDLVGAAEISSKILGGWAGVNATAAEKADFLTHATDQLTKAANASSVDVKGLSLGIFNAQGIAKAAGVSFDDLTTTLAELAPRFASSAEAGTSLKNMIVRLNPTTKAATSAMEGLGLYTEGTGSKFYDAKGNFVGFQQASQLLQESLKGLTKQQQTQALQTIFGNDAMSSASALAELGSAGYTAMADALINANGVQGAAALTQQGYNTALENAKGSVEALQITIGSYLLPVLTQLMNDVVAPAINTLTTFADAVFGSDDAFNALTPDLQALVTVIDAVVEGFNENGLLGALDQLIPGFSDWLPLIEGVAAALGTLAVLGTVVSAVTSATAAITALGAAFTAAGGGIAGVVAILGGPVTLAVAGVALAVGALVVAWQNDWGGIQEKTAAAWAIVQPVFETLTAWLEENIPHALQTASDFFDKYIFPVLSDLADVYIVGAMIEIKALATVWENVLWPALKVVWSFLKDDLIPIISALVDIHMAVMQKAGEAIAGVWQKVLLPAITSVSDYISTNFGPTIKEIGNWLSSTFGPTLQNVTGWLGDVTGGFSGMGNAIQGTIKYLKDMATSISNLKLPDWATPGSPTPWEIALRGIGDALHTEVIPGVNNFGSALSGMGTAAAGAATDITAQLGDALTGGNLVKDAKALGKNVISGLVSGIENNLRAIDKAANKAADKVKDAFAGSFDSHSPAGIMIPFGSSLIEGLAAGLMQAAPGLYVLINQIGAQLVANAGKKINDDIREQNAEITAGLEDMVKDIQSKIGDFNISILSSGADLDRQMAANIGAMDELSAHAKGIAKQQLDEAAKIAATLNDPKQQADYFKARSDAIMEMAQLQSTLDAQLSDQTRAGIEKTDAELQAAIADKSTNDVMRQSMQQLLNANQAKLKNSNLSPSQISALQQQIQLIGAAQQKEGAAQMAAFAQGSESSDITHAIADLLSQLQGIKDSPITVFDPVIKQFMALIGQLSTTPAAVQHASQYASQGTGASYATNINMPIYTNQSPAVMQQSMAIIGATL